MIQLNIFVTGVYGNEGVNNLTQYCILCTGLQCTSIHTSKWFVSVLASSLNNVSTSLKVLCFKISLCTSWYSTYLCSHKAECMCTHYRVVQREFVAHQGQVAHIPLASCGLPAVAVMTTTVPDPCNTQTLHESGEVNLYAIKYNLRRFFCDKTEF